MAGATVVRLLVPTEGAGAVLVALLPPGTGAAPPIRPVVGHGVFLLAAAAPVDAAAFTLGAARALQAVDLAGVVPILRARAIGGPALARAARVVPRVPVVHVTFPDVYGPS
ncbi:hypothetical protein Pflav_070340 [Phytohabitans flavus]|uniref:Uncharacterized protein n=1 Tax=Phytohabitans flavus TaxID=1076124 RepID=A0A6F8Y3C7_9ACTN|nr:hypothetical protein Pflav_070340 [Phytohabitans flavus]